MEEDESWANGVPAEVVAYARELAVSPEQVTHWVTFLTEHPHGQLAWEEIRHVWKPARGKARARKSKR